MKKRKKYRVILDFWEAYQNDAEELRKEDPELDEETAEQTAYDSICDDLNECITPDYDDEATAENIDLILDLAGVDRDTRRELGRIADDVNRAQWNNAEDHPDLENYHPLSIEDFIDALKAVEDNGGIDEVRATASFYISDQAVRILLSTYGLLWDSGIDLDEVKSVIYD